MTAGLDTAPFGTTEFIFTVTSKLVHVVVLHAFSALTKYCVVVEGVTVIVVLFPSEVPPQDPLYHAHTAPSPSDPPDKLTAVEFPSQIVDWPEEMDGVPVDAVFIDTLAFTQLVVLQIPSALK